MVWRVRKIVMEHNHDLTPAGMIHMMPNFRSMTDGAKAQINGMHDHGVTTSKILGYMAAQAGGYSFVGLSKKYAYNYVQRSKCERISNGHSSVAIGYLEGKVTSDPMSTARYLLTEDKMLANMLWADGGSRIDYQFFGDVLAFDSTYKKNKYRRPLVIFSGSNNHKQTSIFGFGLLMDETVASYKWLLENFVEAMCNRKPSVVVTDGDDAMKAAIKAVIPEATHRLCAWHMEKNVTTNVKWDGLRSLFRKWLYADMGIEEFEQEWHSAMEEYQTGDQFWFRDMYDKRRMWANAYLNDKFCAGFRTISRCEGINAYVKKFVKSRHSLLEMLHGLELMCSSIGTMN
ncbi:hypothetical protein PIB30_117193 [Stylosanthes scabra]|uniref:MULE transposase domain-containing protein n=1 Tax=Stylosanthes scabra TaxID=79078 RepID=A0ABU6ZTH2_9FABA|nr:hypothetical protein [Stylosanthes scabra]